MRSLLLGGCLEAARRARRASDRRPVRLVLLGVFLEAVYLGLLVAPFPLLGWLSRPAQDLGTMTGGSGAGAVRYLAAVAALALGSWAAYRQAERLPPGQATRIGFAFAALFAFTLIWLYPFDALDLFDYAMQGRMLGVLGANPYQDFPSSFPDDPFLPSVGWKTYPSVYGPLWTWLEGGVGRLSGDQYVGSLLAFKSLAALASLASSFFAYQIVRRWRPRQAAGAVFLVGWNPLVVLMAGSGHNGLLMMALVLAGVWLAARGQAGWGVWLAGLSALVKLATLPILPALAIGALAEGGRQGWWRRGWRVLLALAALAAVGLALQAPLWPGLDRYGPLLRQDLFSASPLGLLRETLAGRVGSAQATRWSVQAGQALLLAFTLVAAWRARHGQQAALRAAHDALFWTVFLALPWWQPWYVVWIVCLAAVDGRAWARAASRLASFAALVSLFDRFFLTYRWLVVDTPSHYLRTVLLVFLAPILLALLVPALSSGSLVRARPLLGSPRRVLAWALARS